MVSYYPAPRDQAVAGDAHGNGRETGTGSEPLSYYERESRRRNRQLRDQLRAEDPNGILDLASVRGSSWDSIGVSTALQALAWKVKQGAPRPSFSDGRWKQLQLWAYGQLAEGEARNLANTAWSMANISCMSLPFMTEIAKLAQVRAGELKPQELSNLLWSFSTMRHTDPPVLQALAAEVDSRIAGDADRADSFSCQDAANTMWAFASLTFASGETCKRLACYASTFVFQFKPQECANTLWAMAILDVRDSKLVESIASRARETLPEFRSQNLSNFIWAYAKMGHRNAPLTSTVLQLSLHAMERSSAQERFCKRVCSGFGG